MENQAGSGEMRLFLGQSAMQCINLAQAAVKAFLFKAGGRVIFMVRGNIC
jgi:hypothetical protein